MRLAIAQVIVDACGLYAIAGVIFAGLFLWRGITAVDQRVAGAPVMMRVLIVPGLVALWPLFAWRWASGAGEPIERNPHRVKARAR